MTQQNLTSQPRIEHAAFHLEQVQLAENTHIKLVALQGVWADPVSRDVALVFQAWGVLEAQHGTTQLARELFKCAVKADPKSEKSWAVSACSLSS